MHFCEGFCSLTGSSACNVYIIWVLGIFMNFLSNFIIISFFYSPCPLYTTSTLVYQVTFIILSLINLLNSSLYFRHELEWVNLWLIYHPRSQILSPPRLKSTYICISHSLIFTDFCLSIIFLTFSVFSKSIKSLHSHFYTNIQLYYYFFSFKSLNCMIK